MNDDLKDQSLLYVLGLLESEERRTFRLQLAENAELRQLVDEYRDVLAALSLSVDTTELPATLRSELLEKAFSSTGSTSPASLIRPRFSDRRQQAGWLVAALFAIASVFLLYRVQTLQRERDTLAELSRIQNLDLALLAPQAESFADISASVAWSRTENVGVLQLDQLPPAPPEKSYQLWVFEEGVDAPVSGGVFEVTAGEKIVFQAERSIQKAVAFAVSIEVEGGRPQPEGDVILVGKLSG